MAFSNKEAWEAAPANWRKGIEYIYAQLLSAVERHGIKQINPLGMPFDPREHDSIGTVGLPAASDTAQAGGKEDTVAEVVQKGYSLHGKVLRPAKVKVNK